VFQVYRYTSIFLLEIFGMKNQFWALGLLSLLLKVASALSIIGAVIAEVFYFNNTRYYDYIYRDSFASYPVFILIVGLISALIQYAVGQFITLMIDMHANSAASMYYLANMGQELREASASNAGRPNLRQEPPFPAQPANPLPSPWGQDTDRIG
jgi:hypothetical protein